ncbi:uncharacterized protein Z520_05705 [Fonsecaea multimorphosa CBS 102226]|uniref:FAD-binding domain-containing protein n=1 Tax=Fonsecaea multimorphosa CBS 102226 TaxID=1442371 RepID=A0A0D2K5K0_9EURO|nr:uncharacterized protein Z520_05705 [Fonsecaea multimorphosa CBS 102226]KIX98404.1 hypothetical protein Z520_05705 [Fonsecaea multimorphosa CBS 102226]OAL24598.1 hypothetical protein AYO22_05387 [Fonsecaea multimorphosa]
MANPVAVERGASSPDFETDVVVVGTGPSGGSIASFLGSHRVKGIIIGATSTTAETPRAHITNMAASECLRDIDLEAECRKVASPKDSLMHTRWGYSMAGEEYARLYSWGNGPIIEGKYKEASPCDPVDLPQTVLEPILIRKATTSGFMCRFNTEFVSFEDHAQDGFVDVVVKDLIFNTFFTIRCKYLFGADGARSKILTQLGLPLKQKPGGGLAWNVLVKADLTKHIQYKKGNLHWCYQHDIEHPDFAWIGFPRMVKPWNEWVFIMFPVQGYQPNPPPTEEQWMKRIKQIIGDDSVDVQILNISKWMINDIVAEKYSKGNVFCLGDAVHRHPPSNGLGSNTCIQDAYNLAWKIAYVLKGLAGPELLESYEQERQPVGEAIVERAFQGYLDHLPLWQAAGILAPDAATRVAEFGQLTAATPTGRERRKAFFKAVQGTRFEFQGLGIEMNQRYQSSAVYQADQGPMPSFPGDPVLDHTKSTYPGSRLPHVWLNKAIPEQPIPVLDLAGKGRFTVLTGIGGEPWKEAAAKASDALGITIAAYSIGFRQDYEDMYLEWERVREIEEDGCILVRPDRFIAWRSMGPVDHPEEAILQVLRTILSRKENVAKANGTIR